MSLLKKTLIALTVSASLSGVAVAEEEKKGLFAQMSPNVSTGIVAGVTLVGIAIINDSDSNTVTPPPLPPTDGGDGSDGDDDGDDNGSDSTTSTTSTTSTVATVATTSTTATTATTN